MIPVKSIMPFQGNKQNTNLKKMRKLDLNYTASGLDIYDPFPIIGKSSVKQICKTCFIVSFFLIVVHKRSITRIT